MGSVYLRGKSYIGKYKDENDLWIRKTLGNKNIMTKTMAKEIIKEIERKVKLGEHDMINAKIPTVKVFSKDYLNHVRFVIQKRSWTRDELCLKHLLNFFGSYKLSRSHPAKPFGKRLAPSIEAGGRRRPYGAMELEKIWSCWGMAG